MLLPLRVLVLLVMVGGPLRATETIRERLVHGNDRLIARALSAPSSGNAFGARGEATRLLVYACGYVAPESHYHRDAALLQQMETVVTNLRTLQPASGLFDSGNLESPPDTGFILETLATAQRLLAGTDNPAGAALRNRLEPVILAAADGVATGGVHTPNHRWGVCAALAAAHRLYPNPRYLARIEEWLAEGIDQDADGQYAERSPAYSAKVVNPALLRLATELDRPELLEHIRRNLAVTWWLTEPEGEVVTLASRRQDQLAGAKVTIAESYLPLRWLATHRAEARAAALVAWIEQDFIEVLSGGAFDPNWPLPALLLDPVLAGPLPAAQAPVDTFAVNLPATKLARFRHGSTTATLYGGSDHGSRLGVGSGLAMNPTFFAFRKGRARLEARLTAGFFGTGYFYSDRLEHRAESHLLGEHREVFYYQPLLPEDRRSDGDYALTADGRFFAKMNFPQRRGQVRSLDTRIVARAEGAAWELQIAVTGQAGVPVTVELALTGEGQLEGVVPLADVLPEPAVSWLRSGGGARRAPNDTAGKYVLREGVGRFIAGTDVIEFGPGSFTQTPGRMESEDYTWVNGHLRTEGQRVYLTGVTPFTHVLRVR